MLMARFIKAIFNMAFGKAMAKCNMPMVIFMKDNG
jgi:hypothetical protein